MMQATEEAKLDAEYESSIRWGIEIPVIMSNQQVAATTSWSVAV